MIDNSQRRQIGQRLTDLGIEDDGEIRLAWLTGITGQHVESLDQLTRYEAEALLNELRPVTKSMRTDLIALLGSVGLTEQDEVMNRLRDWTGRGVAGTADLARFEYASIKRKVAEVKHDREQSDQAGEPEQRTLDDDS